ncbi:PREDICTED: protein fem-1 homolog B-like isoform X1 [Amphimedon queenslandica]|uniref:Uncharacterized protein n=2 Tax=Amphimedon queenslandica TaxID=400682 RepID=A0AAN0J1V3_AMPQE|nr:PREDICTED: protein fem-1 homolog B-like isoform X1 [Amphimedon queenslandica]|eukprot:XP_019850706.1 PREDICTED: protein fem-1 homolog B-like isoform X1 [Amphimedon queenslandica]
MYQDLSLSLHDSMNFDYTYSMGFGTPDSWFPNKETTVALCTTIIAAVVASLYIYRFINQKNYPPQTQHVASNVELVRLCEEIKDEPLSTLDHNIRHIISEESRPGPQSFYFKKESDERSALVSASRYGRVDVVKYFMNNYSNCVQVDQTANLDLPVGWHHSMREVHSCTSLYAACFNGSLETVTHLLKANADKNQPDCLGRTPLQVAAQRGHMMLVQELLSSGADVNAEDSLGYTPLLTAVSERHIKIVKVLLENKADAQHCSVNGFSALHIAAEMGAKDIIELILAYEPTLAYQRTYDSKHKLPCPLFLAAAYGHIPTCQVLMEASQCTPAQMPDVLLLWGASLVQPQHHYIRASVQRYWLEALELKEQHPLVTTTVDRHEAYEYHTEMSSVEEVIGYFSSQLPSMSSPSSASTPTKANGGLNFAELGSNMTLCLPADSYTKVCYQSLLIMERCLGYGHPLVIRRLLDMSRFMLSKRRTDQCERLLCRAIEMSRERVSSHPHNSYCQSSELEYEVKSTLKNICDLLHLMYQSAYYEVRFSVFLRYTLTALYSFTREGRYDCTQYPAKINMHLILLLLSVLAAWVYQKNHQLQVDYDDTSDDEYEQCDSLACQLVKSHLFICNGTTLLHLALSKLGSRDSLVRDYIYVKDLSHLVSSLLLWGCSDFINLPNLAGERPLHAAAVRARSDQEAYQLIVPLLQYGAHIDSVNAGGKTAFELARVKPLKLDTPITLRCICYRRIIEENFDYEQLPTVKYFTEKDKKCLRLHDPHNAKQDFQIEFQQRLE